MKVKAIVAFSIFVVLFLVLWFIPVNKPQMDVKDWMELIVLEIPLQLAIHYITGKKCS